MAPGLTASKELGRIPAMIPASLSLLSRTLLLALGLAALPAVHGQEKKVLCFVSHKTSHGFGAHEYSAGCHLIGEWLEKAYPGQIEARYSINWPANEGEFFKGANGVVFFCSGGGAHLVNGHVPEFDKVMRTGAGLACLHYGVEVPIGPSGKGMMEWMGGYFETNWSVNPTWKPRFLPCPDHPAALGVKPFEIEDEWYFHMRFRGNLEGITPILSALATEDTMKRPDGTHSGNPDVRKAVAAKEPQHVAWTYQRGADYQEGRGFGFTGLHYHWNWEDDNFRKTVLNGVAWTLKLEIPREGVVSARPTREALESNALEYGGDQGRNKNQERPKAASAPAQGEPGVKPLYTSPVINKRTPGHAVTIDVTLPEGTRDLYLVVDDAGDSFAFDWSDWAEPRLILADGKEVKLIDLDWKEATSDWGRVSRVNNVGGGEQKIDGKKTAYGIGVHANSLLHYQLPEGVRRFVARGGLDDGGLGQQGGNAPSSVRFLVFDKAPGGWLAANKPQAAPSSNGSHDPAEAVANMEVHPDLETRLFASEPMVLSPSAIDVDARGRVWVCEVVNYRRHLGERREGDRILILEDKDGDGKADGATVFHQGTDIDSAHGICVLGNRVIVSAGEEVFSLYDDNGDGRSDRKELLFSRIGGKQHDHGIHAFHFGPDGRLYFNFGNAGQRLCDKDGNLITDIHGVKCTNENNGSHRQGMVFRCELDGSDLEMLGWNFRNNWEVDIDAFGSLWQSDNDDDGNKGVRINQVMEYGNYGYTDEITGAGWREPRVGMETEIPLQHWHQNDPGVVPNLLQTGAGSPTGICVYEGETLPLVFRGQVIHCDAGPSVVRAYPVKPKGAGYEAEVVNLLEGTRNRWFRPSDVCVAPDGSLYVADWYDPGVGGHAMGDLERGRIFHVTSKGIGPAKTPAPLPATLEGALLALKNPNEATRYLAWTAIREKGDAAKEALQKIFDDAGNPARYRARALWLLGRLDAASATRGLSDSDPDIRVTALRVLRQSAGSNTEALLGAVASAVKDANPLVRREAALALRYATGEKADNLWAELATRAEAGDRWQIEALGIGADLTWATRLAAAQNLPADVSARLLWRSRAPESAARIAQAALTAIDAAPLLRALDFQADPAARELAYATLFAQGKPETALYAAGKLGSGGLAKVDGGSSRLDSLLAPIRGTAEFVDLAEKFHLRGFESELAAFIVAHPEDAKAVTAARLLLEDGGASGKLLQPGSVQEIPKARSLVSAFGKVGDRGSSSLLVSRLTSKDCPAELKRDLVNALAMSPTGGRELLKAAREGRLDEVLKPGAALALARSPDQGLRNDAAKDLPVPVAVGADHFPSLASLLEMPGDNKKGEAAFARATCNTCHRIAGQGVDFGPDLSEIGKKLPREGLVEAILYPSAAISHGFQGVAITTKSGEQLVGYVTGETAGDLQLRLPGGVAKSVDRAEVAKRTELDQSLMPPGLAAILGPEDLMHLVSYLQTLK